MPIDKVKLSRFLDEVAKDIDIPPHKYQDAVNHYQAVGDWLEDGDYPSCSNKPVIYPQGSFSLGTVVRPIRGGVEADYDIDLVCEFPMSRLEVSPRTVKIITGDRLHAHGIYQEMLDEEGKRCWTIQYKRQQGVDFHLDVLPCVSDGSVPNDTSIAITNKRNNEYGWSSSDPKGYAQWFKQKNQAIFYLIEDGQRGTIQALASDIYARVDDVPEQLIHTPLQRTIQLMKRHRDILFNNSTQSCYAPISIIITTLAAQLYRDENDTYTAFKAIVDGLYAYTSHMNGKLANNNVGLNGLIGRIEGGRWYIGNPINSDENFADRWHEDNHAHAKAFFLWVSKLKELLDTLDDIHPEDVRKNLTVAFGAAVTTSHINLIVPNEVPRVSTPKVHIPRKNAPKPWGVKS